METPKTKEFIKFMTAFHGKLDTLGKKQMVVMPKKDDSIVRASRNLKEITTTLAASLNVTDILKADSMLILKDSLAVIEKIYLKDSVKAPKAEAPKAKAAAAKVEAK